MDIEKLRQEISDALDGMIMVANNENVPEEIRKRKISAAFAYRDVLNMIDHQLQQEEDNV